MQVGPRTKSGRQAPHRLCANICRTSTVVPPPVRLLEGTCAANLYVNRPHVCPHLFDIFAALPTCSHPFGTSYPAGMASNGKSPRPPRIPRVPHPLRNPSLRTFVRWSGVFDTDHTAPAGHYYLIAVLRHACPRRRSIEVRPVDGVTRLHGSFSENWILQWRKDERATVVAYLVRVPIEVIQLDVSEVHATAHERGSGCIVLRDTPALSRKVLNRRFALSSSNP